GSRIAEGADGSTLCRPAGDLPPLLRRPFVRRSRRDPWRRRNCCPSSGAPRTEAATWPPRSRIHRTGGHGMSGAPTELEEDLRRLAPAFKDGAEPPAQLHASIMARAAAAPQPPARRSMLRELSLAAALIVFVALVALGFSRLHSVVPGPVKRSPSPSPASGVIPWLPLPANSSKSQPPRIMWPDQAAQDIRQTVTGVQPVLLPAAIPPEFQAQLYDDSRSFSVDYLAAGGRRISFAIVVANPPPGTANVRQSQPSYRGVRAEYQVDDGTVATSHRWLMWTEPGTNISGQPGVPYFLATE